MIRLIALFVGVPVAVLAVLASVILRPQRRRYRPGQPWEYPPVWYLPAHGGEAADDPGHPERAAAGPAAGGGARGQW